MARDPGHDILFEPVPIGPKTLKNRFYQVPHCTGFGTEKPNAQAEHRATKAEGGWAAVCTEYAPVSTDSDETPFVSAHIWSEGDARAFSELCRRAHSHDALVGIELTHTGGHARARDTRAGALAPSQLASDMDPMYVPRVMERSDIRRVEADWATAAGRAREVGFDILYVYGGHSYLPLQFLPPFYNRRTDEYGGSLENRARFWLETLEGVRAAAGGDCAVAVRLCVEALGPGGVELEEGLEFIKLADDLVDLWDVTVGSVTGWFKDAAPSRFSEQGYQLEWTSQVRTATKKPIVNVGRFTSPDKMAEVIRSGTLDLIGAARPSIADPFLPKKVEEGRYDEIRECIGCNICISRAVVARQIGCTQNATAGEEFRRGWNPEAFTRAENADQDVLVVGAGPAGMECAIVLAKRGLRRVHLVDADQEIGGTLRWIPSLPGLGEWRRLLDWRLIQLEKLKNVDVLTGLSLDVEQAREYGADLVICATGASWATDGLNGVTHEPISGADSALPQILTPEQVMLEGKRPPGSKTIIYDCDGYFMGVGMAELLAREGYEVEFVTSHSLVGPFLDETLEGKEVRQQLHKLGVGQRRDTVVRRIEADHIEAADEFGDQLEIPADAVVLVTQRVSDSSLYLALSGNDEALVAEGINAVYRVGDCAAPRILAETIFDGHRLAREIDTPDPSVPLVPTREP